MAEDSSHYKACVSSLRRNGRVSFVGGLGDLAILGSAMVFGDLRLRGKCMSDRKDIPGFMRLEHSGSLKLGPRGGNEVTGKFGLEQWK